MQKLGIFKARSLNRGEKVFHAPRETEGDYILYRKVDGTLVYQPVKP